jgi:two-component system cell cycle response regulator
MVRKVESGSTRVLVVDDNPVVRAITGARLRAAGYDVAEAVDGLAALQAVGRETFPVVITDVSMPGLDGLGLLAALRLQPEPPEVILLTGTHASDAESAVQALRLGAHDYISKAPAAMEAIPLAVERAAEKWRLREENARLLGELRQASLTDALTGVGNRRAFDEGLVQEIARARRLGAGLTLAIFDLDHFKRVNDSLGHRTGDEALVEFASRLRSLVRGGERVFRYGGEEFAVLMAEGAPEFALTAASRIVAAVGQDALVVGSVRLPVTCSAGVAVLRPSDDVRGAELIARADAALYSAKRLGRNRAEAAPDTTAPAIPQPTAAEPAARKDVV